jgi:hypothetical protein
LHDGVHSQQQGSLLLEKSFFLFALFVRLFPLLFLLGFGFHLSTFICCFEDIV